MEIGDLLSKEELSAIKGGEWHYDEETDESPISKIGRAHV